MVGGILYIWTTHSHLSIRACIATMTVDGASIAPMASMGNETIDYTALSAADARWYADILAFAAGEKCSAHDTTTVLARFSDLPWTKCVRLMSDGQSDYFDANGVRWAADTKGRWHRTRGRPLFRLQQRLGHIRYHRYTLGPHNDEFVSHICGFKDCLRLEHIKYQSKREDIADKRHHKRFGLGSIRPELAL